MLVKAYYIVCIFSLLVCTTASAECAWILWEHTTSQLLSKMPEKNSHEAYWKLLGTFITHDQCRQAQQGIWETKVKHLEPCVAPGGCSNRKIQKVPYNYFSVSWENPSKDTMVSNVTYEHECIPDTIDPRRK